MGSLYLRGTTYWLKYYDSTGQPIRESSKSEAKAVAARLLKKREDEITEGRVPGFQNVRIAF